MLYPTYINLYNSGELQRRVEQAFEILKDCNLCPRKCGVNRKLNRLGYCRAGQNLIVYSTYVHLGEEPPISGHSGSGTIFFSNCNLSCVYCQNFYFSQLGKGKSVSSEKLAELMLTLQNKGCHSINLVSPTHFIPQILQSLELAIAKGLDIPLVYNTNGYESISTLKILEGIIDIYLPDLRYSSEAVAQKYSDVNNYWKVSQLAIKEMYRQVGNLKLQDGIARQGLIVRHLILPEGLAGTQKIMNFLFNEISPFVHVSLMHQYYPTFKANEFPPLDRPINAREYEEAKLNLIKAGIKNGWLQEEFSPEDTKRFAGEYL